MSEPAKAPKVYYPFLDGFRGLAIVMILFHHMCRAFDLEHWFYNRPRVLSWIYFKAHEIFGIDLTWFYLKLQYLLWHTKGIIGVQIFLVLSSFLITGILMRSFAEGGTISRFYKRRFLRIYPSYFLAIVVSVILFAKLAQPTLPETIETFLRYTFLLQNYMGRNFLLEHTWTLVVLEQFYFFTPLIILSVYSLFKTNQGRQNALIAICIAFMCLGVFFRIYFLNTGRAAITWPVAAPFPYFTILYNCGSLAFGGLLALLERRIHDHPKNKIVGLMAWVFGITTLCYLFFRIDFNHGEGEWYFYSLSYLAIGALMFAAYNGISTFSRSKTLQWIGRYSYGIYLWHILILIFLAQWMLIVPTTVLLILGFLGCILAGVTSTLTFERFFMTIRERIK